MFVCDCGKGHVLTEHQLSLIDGEQEIRIKHDCGFHIIIGADECQDGFLMYSYNATDIDEKVRDDRLMKAIVVQPDVINIRMRCGHDADWRGITGKFCCSKCAWDEASTTIIRKAAWEQDYEHMYPFLKEA